MEYTAIYDLKNPVQPNAPVVSGLKKKVTIAVVTSAQSILAEAESTPNHSARVRWAVTALEQAEAMAERMMWPVLSNGDVQTGGNDTPDATVQYVVDVSVNLFAR